MSAAVVSQTCECGAGSRLSVLEKDIRILTEKLEYAQLQNSLLQDECNRLRKNLCEAEFRGRSSIRASRPAPSLPDELLRHIFSLATHFYGLALPCWPKTRGEVWHVSFQVRRTIPLVCRRWYNIGIEYLYQHIVMSRESQIKRLLASFNALTPETCTLRTGWIQGLEYLISNAFDTSLKDFSLTAIRFVGILPHAKLCKFAVVGYCRSGRGNTTGMLIDDMLANSGPQLETVHFPCVQDALQLSKYPQLRVRTLSLGPSLVPRADIRLKSWCRCTLPTPDNAWASFITTLSIPAGSIAREPESFFMFLDATTHLEAIHISGSSHSILMANRLDQFLGRIPRVTHLRLDDPCMPNIFPKMDAVSRCPWLEHIEVYLHRRELGTGAPSTASGLRPLIHMIQSGRFPNLQRVSIYGDIIDECVDAFQILPSSERDFWKTAIHTCADRGVELVNQQGLPLKLWRVLHRPYLEGNIDNDMSSSEEDDEWYERDDTTILSPSEVGENDISDSDDEPYRFVYVPDVELVHSDPGTSSDSDGEGNVSEKQGRGMGVDGRGI